jgi:hypothetical protein
MFKGNLEVIIGASTAKNANLKVDDTFASSHGLDSEGEKHEESSYTHSNKNSCSTVNLGVSLLAGIKRAHTR